MRAPAASARRLKEISTQNKFAGVTASGITLATEGPFKSARLMPVMNNEFSSNHSMSGVPAETHFPDAPSQHRSQKNASPEAKAMNAHLAEMQQRIDQRQEKLDENEDRIADIILNQPAEEVDSEEEEVVDEIAQRESKLR